MKSAATILCGTRPPGAVSGRSELYFSFGLTTCTCVCVCMRAHAKFDHGGGGDGEFGSMANGVGIQ